jgi:hypothetical protein
LNILLTPPELHFDKGLGISAWKFRDAARVLLESAEKHDLLLPACYLQRHAIELYLKSLIYILHKKYNVPFEEGFGLENPAIRVGDRWKHLSNTHNLRELYEHFLEVFHSCQIQLPATTDWTLPKLLGDHINLISGYDPKSTYFRYPKASSNSQDQKKSTVQPMDLGRVLEGLKAGSGKPVKASIILDSEDNVVATYNLSPEPIEDVREALTHVVEDLNNLHCAFLGELTRWT